MSAQSEAVAASLDLAVEPRSSRRRLPAALRSPKFIIGAGITAVFVLVAIIGPYLVGDPNAEVALRASAPSSAHVLGTTQTGQDVFRQLVAGTRGTLEVGAIAGIVATIVSIVIGIVGGYAGGFVDEAFSLLSNVFLVIPSLPLVIVISADVKAKGVLPVALVIALTSWAASARVLRAQTLSVRNRDYVRAAKASGERGWRIVLVEILPNELPLIVSQAIFAVIFAVLTDAGLAFLGLGNLSTVSWGSMLFYASSGQALSLGLWWWFVPPGLAIAVFGMALSLINFSLDELMNPRLRTRR